MISTSLVFKLNDSSLFVTVQADLNDFATTWTITTVLKIKHQVVFITGIFAKICYQNLVTSWTSSDLYLHERLLHHPFWNFLYCKETLKLCTAVHYFSLITAMQISIFKLYHFLMIYCYMYTILRQWHMSAVRRDVYCFTYWLEIQD